MWLRATSASEPLLVESDGATVVLPWNLRDGTTFVATRHLLKCTHPTLAQDKTRPRPKICFPTGKTRTISEARRRFAEQIPGHFATLRQPARQIIKLVKVRNSQIFDR